jgi:phosphatidylserine/phosphatidylglycerophosphate/cardiolipin synthase-like enzyme
MDTTPKRRLHVGILNALRLFALLTLVGCQLAAPPAPPRAPAAVAPQQQPEPEAAASPGPNSAIGASLTWAFTQAGDHPDVMLAEGFAAARTEINAALYAFNRQADVDAFSAAQQRCHCARLISDAQQSGLVDQRAALAFLSVSGVPIKVDAHTGLMHLKLVEIDRQVVYEGSFNVTNAASTVNDEILVRVSSARFAAAAAAQFDAMWNDTRRFRDWVPPPPATLVPSPSPAAQPVF